ncbi:CPBP family intramembrane metalloprotease [Rhodococcus sp. PAMC28707]|uniref:CPBP family intramembrane glutamic endopeptidase n=1 Tax=unclassified Rhodococcus (in: high G+C Gram-positive bacteria) TaxID=192944 RepID=UPI00109DE527|nr:MULTISPECIES: CPBP family intramembrane glutamic endopeptidase [unclassified Rhodococcus (in: high G+C Gram-positive bacteria)]QCB51225.1 CPBP family intramembrane metalloprotease [Rhodococcus sp. PAMC28705]QCB60608.1 CPBP family intramembrane metalloprotease [Rhodococcus sp. PAMC28707]
MVGNSSVWSRPNQSMFPASIVSVLFVLGMVTGWLLLYSVSILGALWRMQEPNAPAPVLSVSDQLADLIALAVQMSLGFIAIGLTLVLRRRTLATVLPERHGTALDAAIAWCAAIAGASAVVLVLGQLGIARFDFSVPAVVESPWLAVASALATGLREEPLLAALPVLLLAGRLPIGWIVVLAATMRGLLYVYFGFGGFVWAFLWGAAAVWVYFRFRRLWVLILLHGLVMNMQALDRVIADDNAATILQWCNILVLFGALLYWLVPRALDAVLPGESETPSVDGHTGSDAISVHEVPPTVRLPAEDADRV